MANQGITANDIKAMRAAAGASGPTVINEVEIADLFNTAMVKYGGGQFNTVNRVTALVSECMMESAYFRTTVEYQHTGQSYAPYIGRTFIQVTWKSNYAKFGAWCKSHGLVSDPDYFVKNPVALGHAKWAALGGVWYFTAVKFSGHSLVEIADQGNADMIGRGVNLGNPWSAATPNGASARRAAWNAVHKLGSEIIPGGQKKPAKSAKPKKESKPAAKPKKTTKAKTVTVKSGDTLSGIAAKHGTTVKKLAKTNNIENPDVIYVGQKIKIGGTTSKGKAKTYTVKSGDTLSAIAKKHGTTVKALAKANGIKNPDHIEIGQKLTVK